MNKTFKQADVFFKSIGCSLFHLAYDERANETMVQILDKLNKDIGVIKFSDDGLTSVRFDFKKCPRSFSEGDYVQAAWVYYLSKDEVLGRDRWNEFSSKALMDSDQDYCDSMLAFNKPLKVKRKNVRSFLRLKNDPLGD